MKQERAPILEVCGLCTRFKTRAGVTHAVNGVSFEIRPGEILGVVGESGSGKSVTMMSLMGLLPGANTEISAQKLCFDGESILNADSATLSTLRGGRVGFVFQDPMTSLNPVFTIGDQIAEPLRKHRGLSKAAAMTRAAELLDLVGFSQSRSRLKSYPHQLSGGMRQRVMIALALSCEPEVLIADEPTTALDVTIQAQIIDLIQDLRKKMGMSIIWITHDLGVVAEIADRVLVMYGGQIVEQAPVHELFTRPSHPYTQALLKTLPSRRLDSSQSSGRARLQVISGQPPILRAPPRSCSFQDRCSEAFALCNEQNPQRRAVGGNPAHDAACLRVAEVSHV